MQSAAYLRELINAADKFNSFAANERQGAMDRDAAAQADADSLRVELRAQRDAYTTLHAEAVAHFKVLSQQIHDLQQAERTCKEKVATEVMLKDKQLAKVKEEANRRSNETQSQIVTLRSKNETMMASRRVHEPKGSRP